MTVRHCLAISCTERRFFLTWGLTSVDSLSQWWLVIEIGSMPWWVAGGVMDVAVLVRTVRVSRGMPFMGCLMWDGFAPKSSVNVLTSIRW